MCPSGPGNLSIGLWQEATWANPTGAVTVPRRRGTKSDSKTSSRLKIPTFKERLGTVWRVSGIKQYHVFPPGLTVRPHVAQARPQSKRQLGPWSSQGSAERGFASKLTGWLLVRFGSSRTIGPRVSVPSLLLVSTQPRLVSQHVIGSLLQFPTWRLALPTWSSKREQERASGRQSRPVVT